MMKKFLLLSLLGIMGLAVTPPTYAITTQDLDGKVGAVILYGNPAQYGFASESIAGYFEAVNNSTVKFHNFYGGYTIDFTLSANKLSFVVGTSADRYDFWPTDGSTDRILNFYKANNYRSSGATYYYDTYTSSTSYNTFTSSTYAEFVAGTGFYRFQFNFPLVIEEWTTSGDCLSDLVYNGMDIFVVDVNSIAIDNLDREYLTGYTISGSAIQFKNFFNVGTRYINQTTGTVTTAFGASINGTVSGNNITVPYQEISGVVDFTYQGWTNSGYTATAKSTTQYLNKPNYISSNGNSAAITGSIVNNKPISHLTFDNNWVKDDNIPGAQARTVKGSYIQMNRIVYPQNYYYGYSLKSRTTDASKTYIFGKDADITHKLAIEKKEYGYGQISPTNYDTYLYINFDIKDIANADYVESYDYFIVPGSFSNVNSADFAHENGHKNATLIDINEYKTEFIPKESDREGVKAVPAATEGTLNYNILIPENDLKAKDSNGVYSLFVRANYTAASGLAPTFHALTALGQRTTGVEDIIDNGVNDSDAPVLYYNLNGVLMNGDALTPGIYIRCQGSSTSKVVVK